MKPEELLDAFSQIDPEYVEEAEYKATKKPYKKKVKRFATMAACGCLILSGAYFLHRNQSKDGTPLSKEVASESTGQEESSDAKTEIKEQYRDTTTNEQSFGIPEKIYMDEKCYTRVESKSNYKEKALACLGQLGEEGSSLYADIGLTGCKVYQVEDDRIMVEISGKYYTYEKET